MRLSIIGHVGSNPTFSASQRPINGGVAQLGERVIRIYEVRGSNPLISTIFDQIKQAFKLAFFLLEILVNINANFRKMDYKYILVNFKQILVRWNIYLYEKHSGKEIF